MGQYSYLMYYLYPEYNCRGNPIGQGFYQLGRCFCPTSDACYMTSIGGNLQNGVLMVYSYSGNSGCTGPQTGAEQVPKIDFDGDVPGCDKGGYRGQFAIVGNPSCDSMPGFCS